MKRILSLAIFAIFILNADEPNSTKRTPNIQNKATNASSTNNSNAKAKRQNRVNLAKDRRKKALTTKNIGYRNLTISNIYKQREDRMRFFGGVNLGIEIPQLKYSFSNLSENISTNSTSGNVSIGGKGGILSEDTYVGGRFYGEASYMKLPQFHVLTLGLSVDLLVNYYQTMKWSIGGFLGLGGGMYWIGLADSSLKYKNKVPFSPVGWINVGLIRFVSGNHSFEFMFRYAYVFASIYKDSSTIYDTNGILQNQTIGYKLKSDSLMFSYVFQF